MATNQDVHPLEISENNRLNSLQAMEKQEQHMETSVSLPSSTVWGPIFNFTNSIIGAGAIGLGGKMIFFRFLFFTLLNFLLIEMNVLSHILNVKAHLHYRGDLFP